MHALRGVWLLAHRCSLNSARCKSVSPAEKEAGRPSRSSGGGATVDVGPEGGPDRSGPGSPVPIALAFAKACECGLFFRMKAFSRGG